MRFLSPPNPFLLGGGFKQFQYGLVILLLSLFTSLVQGEVVLDGTLGPANKLAGPHFQITSDLGQQVGGNLFHSFSQFNLNKEESATFSGFNTVQNIISRITGGESSTIDGILRSTIPNADFYLINTQGFIFGPNARLDIQGSVHITTAPHIFLGTAGKFDAQSPENSTLVSAPPTAFGFIEPAPIAIKSSQLNAPEGKTLSLSAGELDIDGGHLTAVSGQVNLIAVTSGEVILDNPTFPIVKMDAQLGNITFRGERERASIDVGKQGAGEIYIRGGKFELHNSDIVANTGIDKDGGTIAIEVTSLQLTEGATIDSRTFGPGQGGHIVILAADKVELADSDIFTTSHPLSANVIEIPSGNAGNITLQAQCLQMTDSTISTTTFGDGAGGDILITVRDDITLTSTPNSKVVATIQATSEGQMEQGGNAGRILITSHTLNLTGNSKIDNSTLGTGHGGNVKLEIADTLRLQEGGFIIADSKGTGNAGNIIINTSSLEAQQGAISTAADKADGGNIMLNVRSHLDMTNSQVSATVSGGRGDGGNIAVSNSRSFHLHDSGVSANANEGNGGIILIISGNPIEVQGNSSITAFSKAGTDGEVKIDFPDIDLSALPIVFLDASNFIKKRCIARSLGDQSSFIVVGQRGLPNAPSSLQGYTPVLDTKQTKKP